MEIQVSVPRSIWYTIVTCAVLFVAMLIFCWYLTIQISRSRAYDLGRFDEAMANPARVYIQDGTPFVWYKGTYFKARLVRAKTFVVE